MGYLEIGLLRYLPNTIIFIFMFYFLCRALDFFTGILKTFKNKNYRSRKMRDGIIRWIAEMLAIVFVLALDLLLGLNFLLCGFTLALFIYKEAGSILENLAECGVTLPSAIKEKLEIFNIEKGEEK